MRSQLARDVGAYVEAHGLTSMLRADLVLMLLRIGTPEALRRAEKLAGVAITRCPPAVPPWPPKPVQRTPAAPRVTARVPNNPLVRSSGAYQRFAQVKVGMTVEQLLSRGITRRDIRCWRARQYLEIA